MIKDYPSHIYEPARAEVAISYMKHEFRKLLWRFPEKDWPKVDRDISDWMQSPQLAIPRDFWNGFHGISMGFKLKIGLIYLVTAENITWRMEEYTVKKLWFGVEQGETRKIREGKLSAKEVTEFYSKEKNRKAKEEFIQLNQKLSKETPPRDHHPIIVIQELNDNQIVLSVHDGNRRLAKSILEGKEKIKAYIGEYTNDDIFPKNYWIPTSLLMDNLFFARRAYDNGNKILFNKYIDILRDMLDKSESAVYEMKNRALTRKQPFRKDVLKALKLL